MKYSEKAYWCIGGGGIAMTILVAEPLARIYSFWSLLIVICLILVSLSSGAYVAEELEKL